MRRVKASVALGVGAAFAMAFGVGVERASAISNPSGTSQVEITNPAFSGFTTWRINGVDHAFSNTYWVRVPGQGVQRVDDLDFVGQLGGGDSDDFVTGLWRDPQNGFDVQIGMSVSDGNPTQLPVNITVKKSPNAQGTLGLEGVSVYEYSDMDLGQTGPDETLTIDGGNDTTQTDRFTAGGMTFDAVYQQNSAQQPDHYTAGLKMSEADVQALFANDLNDTNSFPVGVADDGAFAFQWTFNLDTQGDNTPSGLADDEFKISITKSIRVDKVIPEPATTMLGLAGISALGAYLSRRRRNA